LHGGEQLVKRDDDAHPGIPQLVLQLVRCVERIGWHDHCTGPQSAIEGDQELRHVGQHDGHAFTGLDAECSQARGEGVDLSLHVAIAQFLSAEDGNHAIRIPRRGVLEELRERDVRVVNRPWNLEIVMGIPGPVHAILSSQATLLNERSVNAL